MSSEASPRKIAILGGGIGALSTAWYLTNDPHWQEKYEITVHQLGWRLGGKCASSRNFDANGRIEEHGIHGFLGSYYNALRLMVDCYAELGRKPGQPLATFQDAFLPVGALQLFEFHDRRWKLWAIEYPPNDNVPWGADPRTTISHWIATAIEITSIILPGHGPLGPAQRLIAAVAKAFERAAESREFRPVLRLLDKAGRLIVGLIERIAKHNDDVRRKFIQFDFLVAMIRGLIADDVVNKGFDVIDDQDYIDWLRRHGASQMTLESSLTLNVVNTLFAYPHGDSTLPPRMAAGVYAHWSLRQLSYLGSLAWEFAAGTGETVIAPLYLVLKQRGVKFEFFHRVEALHLSADGSSVQAVDVSVQATVEAGADAYEPLVDTDGLPCWPARPLYGQLAEGDALKATEADLESWWTPWTPVQSLRLEAGIDFDHVVFALSIGAVPYVCRELLAAKDRWRRMVEGVPAIQTQAMQIWLKPSSHRLGWTRKKATTAPLLTATYLVPTACVADFSHLIHWEHWPSGEEPKTLVYACGPMPDDGPATPPFDHYEYPRDMHQRVKWQSIQFLQAGVGPILPRATGKDAAPSGDPVSLDFRLLARHNESKPGEGVFRFNQQFWRANIDPTERYVTSPPGSTSARLKPWESGFANLTLAGDWTYTGLNAGCVEATVMSGMLASHAICGSPPFSAIISWQPHLPPAPGPRDALA
ncbi:MAG: NAD(P)-binding protein [Dehalococcoidia bacterium]